ALRAVVALRCPAAGRGVVRARALLRRLRARRRRAGRSGRGALVGGVRQPALGDHDAHAGPDLPRRRAQRRAREPRPPDVRDGAGAARSDGRRNLTMQDRPSVSELLRAVRGFLEDDLVPALEGRRRFHALVAANVLAIVERELGGEGAPAARQWDGGAPRSRRGPGTRPGGPSALPAGSRARGSRLVERIRSGEADVGDLAVRVRAHVRATVLEKLAVANPKYLEGARQASR